MKEKKYGYPAVILKDHLQWNCRDSLNSNNNQNWGKKQLNKCYCFGFIEFKRLF